MVFLVQANEPDDALPRPGVVLDRALHPLRDRAATGVGSLEAGLKYLIVGGFGSAVLLFGSALVYGATGELGFGAIADAITAQGLGDDALLLAGLAMMHRRARLQGLGGAVPHVDAGRLRGRADAGDRVHGGRDEGGARSSLTLRVLVTAFPERGRALDDRDRRDRLRLARGRQPRRARPAEREADARVLVRSRTPASC